MYTVLRRQSLLPEEEDEIALNGGVCAGAIDGIVDIGVATAALPACTKRNILVSKEGDRVSCNYFANTLVIT